jgi:energy-coupling factor transporter ATP-binding protein EcfA2
MKLTFKPEFEKYISISKPFGIPEFRDFNIITGINGSGKTHFLKAISNEFIAISIDDEKISPKDIKFFDYETFKLKNQQSATPNLLQQEEQKVHNSLSSLPFLRDKQYQDAWDILQNQFNLKSKFFVIPKLFELKSQNNLDSLDEIKEFQGKIMLERLKKSLLNDATLNQWKKQIADLRAKDTNIKEYLDSKEDLLTLTEDELEKIIMNHQDSNFLEAGFGKIFKKTKDLLDQKYHDEEWREETFPATDEKFQKEFGEFPWVFMDKIFDSYREGQFEFKYKTKRPSELANQDLKPQIINTETNENVDFEDLSSGEKILMALTLFLYQAERSSRFPKVLLLDEIDAPLHPSMCKNLISTLKENIVAKETKIILATHNSSTVAHCDEASDGIFIKDDLGIKEVEKKEALSILSDGIISLSDVLVFKEFDDSEIIGISEGNNYKYLNKAKEFFANSIDIKFIGFKKDLGDGDLRTLFNFLRRLNTNKKIFYIWDCDYKHDDKKEKEGKCAGLEECTCNKLEVLNKEKNKNNIPMIFPQNTSNKIVTRGIENMFQEKFFKSEAIKYQKVKNKKKIERKLLNEGTIDDYENFRVIFQEIEKEIGLLK